MAALIHRRISSARLTTPDSVRACARPRYAGTMLLLAVLFTPVVQAATKVAFIADQGVGSNAQAVLAMVRSEGAQLLLIQGDLGYNENRATRWEDNLTEILGRDFPVLSVVGNHEDHEWPLYKQFIEQRVNRSSGLSCNGNVGVKASCSFGNIQIVQAAPKIYEVPGINADDDYAGYIRDAFDQSTATWRICSWHKNEYKMQVHSKDSNIGWDIFDACLDAGAMVVMGHAHTYSRTYLLNDFENQQVVHRGDDLELGPGQSFAVVSGLGGYNIKPQSNGGDWFASIYTASQGASHGALFCTLGEQYGDCYFKSINGSTPDTFRLSSVFGGSGRPDENPAPQPDNDPPAPPTVPTLSEPAVFSRTDKTEYRWLARNTAGQWGSRWIDEICAQRLGGATLFGNWSELIALAPATDSVASPCDLLDDGSPAPPPPDPADGDGFVFSRTDKTEFRWIAMNGVGQLGSIWIDSQCADDFGGPSVRGDWQDLMALAPGFDTLDSPCTAAGADPDPGHEGAQVFSRTDKTEYRWIDINDSGQLGSTWIDESCAESLGGPTVFGDWSELLELAPGFDTIAYPCN